MEKRSHNPSKSKKGVVFPIGSNLGQRSLAQITIENLQKNQGKYRENGNRLRSDEKSE